MGIGVKNLAALAAAVLGLWVGARYLLPLFLPFLLGTGLALLAEPLVRLLSGRLRLPRALAAGLGVAAAFAGMTVLIAMVLGILVRELGALAGVLPDLTQTARSGVILLRDRLLQLADQSPQSLQPMLRDSVGRFFSGGTALLDRVFGYGLTLAGTVLGHVPQGALTLGTGVVSGFMISAKLPRIRRWLARHLPVERLRPLVEALARLRRALGGWILAQIKLAGVTLGILLAGLLILRVPYAPLWAAGICLLDALPVLGTGTVLLPWALVAFLQADRARGVGLLGIYAVITLTRSVLEPRLVGKQLGLDPLVTLFSLYAGYRIWGLMGMILAPLAAVTAVQLVQARPGRGELRKNS